MNKNIFYRITCFASYYDENGKKSEVLVFESKGFPTPELAKKWFNEDLTPYFAYNDDEITFDWYLHTYIEDTIVDCELL